MGWEAIIGGSRSSLWHAPTSRRVDNKVTQDTLKYIEGPLAANSTHWTLGRGEGLMVNALSLPPGLLSLLFSNGWCMEATRFGQQIK